ncbi:DUF72 domain-containing protein [Actinoplanes sp. NPDC051470]|uniref:DUF72 domain-containing protein n=1 Tax=unclassified Actinoplanes TaxID=2626549 RepID=UPI003427A6BB
MIGTSGWQYRDWKGAFYPDKLPQRLWLERYAESFATVEVNNAFYRLPEKSTFEGWRKRTPADFSFAVKMSRYLTHIKRLKEPAEPVARFLSRAAGLGDKLGPVLIQLPPTMRADPAALDETLRHFPADVRVAVEPRHPSWWTDQVRDVLGEHGAALAWADRRGRPQSPLWVTAGWSYVRFHEGRANPWPRYGVKALDSWLSRLPGRGEAYAYFNNDQHCAAVADTSVLARRARRPTSRTP